MAQLIWHHNALRDLLRLHDFLGDKDPVAAHNAIQAIEHGSALLIAMPRLGRPLIDSSRRRELVVAQGSGAYVLRYQVESDLITILRIWHAREDR